MVILLPKLLLHSYPYLIIEIIIYIILYRIRESNSTPSDYKTDAIPC